MALTTPHFWESFFQQRRTPDDPAVPSEALEWYMDTAVSLRVVRRCLRSSRRWGDPSTVIVHLGRGRRRSMIKSKGSLFFAGILFLLMLLPRAATTAFGQQPPSPEPTDGSSRSSTGTGTGRRIPIAQPVEVTVGAAGGGVEGGGAAMAQVQFFDDEAPMITALRHCTASADAGLLSSSRLEQPAGHRLGTA